MNTEHQIIIDCTPYTYQVRKPVSNQTKCLTIYIDNFLGMEGIEQLKRNNPYSDPCGEVKTQHGYCLIEVEPEQLKISFMDQSHYENDIEQLFLYLLDAYASIGWECLRQY